MANGRQGRGRPRDPNLDGRVLAAALAEYARTGWAAFTMDAVARHAGVGKSALYLRWPTKERLLVDAIEAHTQPLVADIDTGSLRGDALALTTRLLTHFLDPVGWVTLRIAVDAAVEASELGRFHERITRMHNEAAMRILLRGVDRGELSADVPPQPVIEGLFGTVLLHALAMRPEARDHARAHPEAHVTPFVDLVLAGAGVATHAAPAGTG